LRKIHGRPEFSAGDQVKISRRSVKATIMITSLTVRSDAMLQFLFDSFTRGLPVPNGERKPVSI
jgi:farnesyl-diphosphate farnesyltransferase